ncbi:MAG: hypothetical protein ACHQ4F_13675 [Candidatus Dormibacteria bacterium]
MPPATDVYTAQDAIDLIKIRTLAEAGVPLTDQSPQGGAGRGVPARPRRNDDDLTARIRGLRHTQRRLRELASGQTRLLPAVVDQHLQRLGELGFSPAQTA